MQHILSLPITQTKTHRSHKSRVLVPELLLYLLFILAHWQCRSVDFHFLLQAYNIHVNGVLHCRVRYSQLLSLHEQVSLQTLMELWSRNTHTHTRGAQSCLNARTFSQHDLSSSTRNAADVPASRGSQSRRIRALSFLSSNSSSICM